MVVPLLLALIAALVTSVVARKIFFPDGPPWEDQGDGYAKYFFSGFQLLHIWIARNLADDEFDLMEAVQAAFCVYGPPVIGLLVYFIGWKHGLP
ncbi:MAG TPA: hypothetical protein VGM62_09615 [Chthoniobacterales bacterium]|jgi:hypothetical protein